MSQNVCCSCGIDIGNSIGNQCMGCYFEGILLPSSEEQVNELIKKQEVNS